MPTCPRCGQPLQTPVAACPRCGQPFAPPGQPYQANGYDGQVGWGHQPQPTRAPQHPQPPQSQQQGFGPQPPVRPGFSMSELVSEEALPDWLRQASAESAQPTQRQPAPGGAPYGPTAGYSAPDPGYPAANSPGASVYGGNGGNGGNGGYGGGFAPRPANEPPLPAQSASAFPGIESAGSYQAPLVGGGMPASSLLDPNALPGWLSGQQGQTAQETMRGGEGLRAQSLVDDSVLPGWMRNEPASPPPAPAAPLPPAVPGWGAYPAASPAAPANGYGGYSGYDGYGGANMGGVAGMAGASQQPPAAMPMAMNGQPGFSAAQLVDPNALPDWMKAEGGAGAAPAGQPQRPSGQMPGQQGWSASDLIDPAMLPGFVRANDAGAPQNYAANPANPGNPAPRPGGRDFGASRAGTAQRPAAPRHNPSARPLNDREMPDWLRDDAPSDAPNGFPNGYGREGMNGVAGHPPPRQDRNGRSWSGYNARDAQGQQAGRTGRHRRAPAQGDQSWAAPDGYDSSPWGRSQPMRSRQQAAAKRRKGGFFGFLRRG